MPNTPAIVGPSFSVLREAYARAGQEQVFRFGETLPPAARAELLAQCAAVDLAEIARLAQTLVLEPGAPAVDFSRLRPAEYIALPTHGGDAAAWQRAHARGEEALRAGRVACFTVAGGQGTRLGFDGPKGVFPVTPVRRHSLFQVFAEKIRAAGCRYGRTPPWFIMTSAANHAATVAFFAEHRFFGLAPEAVHFFPQGQMPSVDFGGKLLLGAPGRLALSPDGHGGALRALVRRGAVDTMRALGVDLLSYFQVDNPLVRCVDAAFLGFHLEAGAEMSSKMTLKTGPDEKVGHFCRDENGRLVVIEYTDMPSALTTAREPGGALRFRAGSIAIHVLDREFVARLGGDDAAGGSLPFHRADKKIPTVDAAGQPLRPEQPNGVKFELFVFDAIPLARQSIVMETDRAEEFSPVKNSTGADSVATCRDDQLRLFARWLRAAGADVPVDATSLPPFPLEISPLFGDDAPRVAARWAALHPKPAVAAGLALE